MSAVRKKAFEPMEQQVGQDRPTILPAELDEEIGRPEIEVVDGPTWPSRADELAFMNEPVRIIVHESADPTASPVVDLANDGRPQYVIRGREQVVARRYVEVLARLKITSYTQDMAMDQFSGHVTQRMVPHTGLAYPFSVLEDRNPRGRDWLKKILAEP